MSFEIRGMAPLLSVYDMPTSIRFYRDVLGFTVVTTSQPDRGDDVGWCMLRRGDVDLMLNTAYDDGERPAQLVPEHYRLHQDTCLYFGAPDVDGVFRYLRERGVPVEPPEIAHYGMKQLYVRDPDGYSLCFQWPSKG
jgi:glyoxylase I family protein